MPQHPETMFAHESVSESDCEALLNGFPPGHVFYAPGNPVVGHEEDLTIERFDDQARLFHLMARAGLFASAGQARKNGWDRLVEPGYRQYVVGKRKHRVIVIGPMPV